VIVLSRKEAIHDSTWQSYLWSSMVRL